MQADLAYTVFTASWGISDTMLSPHIAQKPHKQVNPQRKGHCTCQIFSWNVIPVAQLCLHLLQTFSTAKGHKSTASRDKRRLGFLIFFFKSNNISVTLISLKYGLLPLCKSGITGLTWMELNLESFKSSWDPNSPISNILFQIAKLLVRTQTLFLWEEFKWVVSDVFTERAGEFICTLQRTSSSL